MNFTRRQGSAFVASDDRAAKPFESRSKLWINDQIETALQAVALSDRESAGRRWRDGSTRQRALPQCEAGNRPIAEKRIYALDDNGLQMLKLDCGAGGDAQLQRSFDAGADVLRAWRPEGKLDRRTEARQFLTDDGGPLQHHLRLGKTSLTQYRGGDPAYTAREGLHDPTFPLRSADLT